MAHSPQSRALPAMGHERETLIDVLDRVLDKGVVIAGDISISLLDIELLTLRIRLLVASVDKAQEMGIDWWQNDPFLSRRKEDTEDETRRLRRDNRLLRKRLRKLEDRLGPSAEAAAGQSTD